jgi:hypothetical protein
VARAVQPPRDIASHPAEANHTQLHWNTFFCSAEFLPVYTLMQ